MDILQKNLMFYFRTRFFTLLIKVEMVDQTETFNVNEHIHDAFDYGDVHLKFGNLKIQGHRLVQFQHQGDCPLLKA